MLCAAAVAYGHAYYWGGFEFGNVDFGIFDDRGGDGAATAAAAAAAAADDDDDVYADDSNNVDSDNVHFQMLSINMLTMILMSNMTTTATTHLPALAVSRLPLQEWTHPSTLVCSWRSCRSYKIPGRVQG